MNASSGSDGSLPLKDSMILSDSSHLALSKPLRSFKPPRTTKRNRSDECSLVYAEISAPVPSIHR